MSKNIYYCSFCGGKVERYPSTVGNPSNVFCNKKHYFEWQRMEENKAYGEKNPNYGTIWTDEQRETGSIITKKRYDDPEYRYNIGKSNRGKTLSKEIRQKMSDGSKGKGTGPRHSEESKREIGKRSSERFKDPIYVEKYRKTMEERGHWIPLKDKKDIEIYNKESNWIDRMFDLIIDKDQLNLLSECGVFHSTKNSKGVVRDHIYSRKSGCYNKVFPEILRHPCNCQLLTHAENISKSQSNSKLSDDITLYDLFDKILDYKCGWEEQNKVETLIEEYKNGKRWEV